MIVVTTNSIPGYRIVAVLGEVMGLTVRSANFGASLSAGFRAMGGGEIPEYTQVVYQSRQEVMHRMVVEGERRGANAIIAMRFDTGSIGQSFAEVCAYGTAVAVEPIPGGEEGSTEQSAKDQGSPAPQPYPQPSAGPAQYQQLPGYPQQAPAQYPQAPDPYQPYQ